MSKLGCTSMMQISSGVLVQVRRRIKELENNEKIESSESIDLEKKQFQWWLQVIPFLMMYIFLNHEYIYENKQRIPSNFFKEAKKELELKKSILKIAMKCVNKLHDVEMTKG